MTNLIYVVRDADDHVLYVGRTGLGWDRRWGHHRSQSLWAPQAVTVDLHILSRYAKPAQAEAYAIQHFHPECNQVLGLNPWPPTPGLTDWSDCVDMFVTSTVTETVMFPFSYAPPVPGRRSWIPEALPCRPVSGLVSVRP